MPSLTEFNLAERATAVATIRPCLDVDRWIHAVVDSRPYADLAALLDVASTSADPFTDAELASALKHHPRIGEPSAGASTEAGLSRAEQSGVSLDAGVRRRLTEENRAYEARFGHVFLIRAAGRSSEDVLAALEERLDNDADTEKSIMADELRQIALLRLEGIFG